MRNAFADEITKVANENPNVVLLSGDIGNRLFDAFKEKSAARFFNCGVAEANMIGVAAGLALGGLRPVVYTINSFLLFRAFEQIRLDLCYHNVPVVLVGVGAGLGYASLGPTHHSLEDIAIMRVLPHMTVLCPSDPVETRLALREALKQKGPVYIRLGKKGEPVLHKTPPDFKIGRGIVMQKGKDVCLLGAGVIMPMVLAAAEELKKQGLEPQVVEMPTIKPLDTEMLKSIFSSFRVVGVVEEHSRIGGLGSAVSEWVTGQDSVKAKLISFGTSDTFLHKASDDDYARDALGLTKDDIVKKILTSIRN